MGFVEEVEEDILGAFELDELMMDGILTGRDTSQGLSPVPSKKTMQG